MSALPIANTDCRTTECSTSDSLGDVSWIQKAASQLYRKNVPLLYTSRYIIPCDSVLPGLPRVSTASNKRWGEKGLGTRLGQLHDLILCSHDLVQPPLVQPDNSAALVLTSLVPSPSHPSIAECYLVQLLMPKLHK